MRFFAFLFLFAQFLFILSCDDQSASQMDGSSDASSITRRVNNDVVGRIETPEPDMFQDVRSDSADMPDQSMPDADALEVSEIEEIEEFQDPEDVVDGSDMADLVIPTVDDSLTAIKIVDGHPSYNPSDTPYLYTGETGIAPLAFQVENGIMPVDCESLTIEVEQASVFPEYASLSRLEDYQWGFGAGGGGGLLDTVCNVEQEKLVCEFKMPITFDIGVFGLSVTVSSDAQIGSRVHLRVSDIRCLAESGSLHPVDNQHEGRLYTIMEGPRPKNLLEVRTVAESGLSGWLQRQRAGYVRLTNHGNETVLFDGFVIEQRASLVDAIHFSRDYPYNIIVTRQISSNDDVYGSVGSNAPIEPGQYVDVFILYDVSAGAGVVYDNDIVGITAFDRVKPDNVEIVRDERLIPSFVSTGTEVTGEVFVTTNGPAGVTVQAGEPDITLLSNTLTNNTNHDLFCTILEMDYISGLADLEVMVAGQPVAFNLDPRIYDYVILIDNPPILTLAQGSSETVEFRGTAPPTPQVIWPQLISVSCTSGAGGSGGFVPFSLADGMARRTITVE